MLCCCTLVWVVQNCEICLLFYTLVPVEIARTLQIKTSLESLAWSLQDPLRLTVFNSAVCLGGDGNGTWTWISLLSLSDGVPGGSCPYLPWGHVGEGMCDGSTRLQPLCGGRLCFVVGMPLGINTLGSRSHLNLKGNLNSYSRLKGNLGLAKRMVMSGRRSSLEGDLRVVEGSRKDGWG